VNKRTQFVPSSSARCDLRSRWSLAFSAVGLSMLVLIFQAYPTDAADQREIRKFTERHALVIANEAYKNTGSLPNAVRDGKDIAQALKEGGYTVEIVTDADLAALRSALDRFSRQGDAADRLNLLYYTGQGATINGVNYMVPVDVEADTADKFKRTAVPLSEVADGLSRSSSLNVLVLDGSQTDPFVANRRNDTEKLRGFVPGQLPLMGLDNVVMLYSSLSGTDAEDGPFARAFLKNLKAPAVEWDQFVRYLTFDMLEATQGRQRPAVVGLPPRFSLTAIKEARISLPTLNDLKLKERGRVVLIEDDREVPVYADGSYALLIGISDYDNDKVWAKLPGVKKDIEALEKVLTRRHGFEVTTVLDPSDSELEAAFKQFIRVYGPRENARLLVFYAGHGYTTPAAQYQIGWIVPRNAPDPVGAPEAFAVTALSMRRINEYSEIIKSKHVLWLFDSCFSGSVFDTSPSRAREESLPEYYKRPIRRVITSGSANEAVPDKSVFAEMLLEAFNGERRVGRRDDVFTDVELGDFLGDFVQRYRDRRQTPQSGVVPLRGLDRGRIVFQVPAK
jgi:uncharacterized caspase-like protein